MLVSLHQSFVSDAKLMEAAVDWNVSDHVGDSIVLLEPVQFLFQPFDLLTWVLTVVKKPPVKVIAGLGINRYNFTVQVSWKRFRVVTILTEHFNFIIIKPVITTPVTLDMVDWPVTVRF